MSGVLSWFDVGSNINFVKLGILWWMMLKFVGMICLVSLSLYCIWNLLIGLIVLIVWLVNFSWLVFMCYLFCIFLMSLFKGMFVRWLFFSWKWILFEKMVWVIGVGRWLMICGFVFVVEVVMICCLCCSEMRWVCLFVICWLSLVVNCFCFVNFFVFLLIWFLVIWIVIRSWFCFLLSNLVIVVFWLIFVLIFWLCFLCDFVLLVRCFVFLMVWLSFVCCLICCFWLV